MNHRLTVTAAAATVLASIAMYPLISRTGWFFDGPARRSWSPSSAR